MKRLFSCMRHVASYDKTDADEPGLNDSRKLPTGPLGLVHGEYAFVYSYPLSKEVAFMHSITAETTAQELLQFAADDYRRIYDEEDHACGPTGNIPGMLNRARSNGPYGVWGHTLEDLFFEAAKVDSDAKRIEFEIGS